MFLLLFYGNLNPERVNYSRLCSQHWQSHDLSLDSMPSRSMCYLCQAWEIAMQHVRQAFLISVSTFSLC